MSDLADYIRRMRDRAEKNERDARETTSKLCQLNSLMIYKAATAHIPLHLRESTDQLAEEVLSSGTSQSESTEGT